MSFEERKGDIFDATDLDMIAHGVNCKGVVGAGFAKQVAEHYPWAQKLYARTCAEYGLLPGEYLICHSPDSLQEVMIAHLATQDHPGRDARLRWIASSVSNLLDRIETSLPKIQSIGLPRIGCGIGGLEWFEVRTILEMLGNESATRLVVFSL